ncbi:PKD domain-containing protein [Lewinella sp. LCG006]|uniref:PKD domain-containing protein n=1 Tax=Lewinella sp. LCG006 TaxID=3231911 RepID=UPI0034604173
MRKLHFFFIAFLLPLWMMAQITVTSTADSGPGTLRQAVIDIPVGGTIDFNVGGPILLTSGQINLEKNMTLDASGPGLVIDASGNGTNRIFGVYGNAVVNLRNIEMANANSPGAFGGAIEVSVATLNAANCTFRNNSGGPGGAVSVGFGTGNFFNCNFIDNSGTLQGGALDINTNSTSTVANCLFYNNQSSTNGGAIALVFSATGTIVNNTISENSASNGGGVFQDGSAGDITLYNNIIANNTGSSPDFAQLGPSFTADNNLIGDANGSNIAIGTNGNITGDPRFVSPGGGNYRLNDNSPAINAGDASLLPTDILDVDGDGAGETLDVDLDLTERIKVCALDMGAFESAISALYVTNTEDSGPGSLRAAINCANAEPGIDDIFFDIDGGGSHTINVATVLPTLIDDGIIVYGTSQPGYAGTPLITLDGGGTAEDGFRLIGDGQGVLGMKIVNFPGQGIGMFVATNFNIFECIITENGFSQIFLGAAQFGSISENILNIDENGVANSQDATGIWFQESTRDISVFNNTMGGLNNSSTGIITMLGTGSSFNIFTDNFIGTNAAGDDYGGNFGIYVQDDSSNQFIRNTISFNQTGIFNRSGSQNNFYSETNFFCNENAAIAMEGGGNGGIQPPVITSATPDAVSGTAAPNAVLHFYFQDNTACPGNTTCQGSYIGTLTADGSGNFTGPAILTEGQVITATQYDPTTLNTSALADCATVMPDPCNPDLDDPTITLLVNDVTIECSEGIPGILVPGVDIIAADACDGDISANIQYVGSTFDDQDCSNGTIQIITDTYRITDAAGNTAEVQWVQTRIDTEPPVWDDPTLSLSLTAECGDDIDALLAANLPTATDGCDLTTVEILLDGALATPLCGLTSETTYFYQAVDQCGNANPDFYTITVTTTDNTAPTFTSGPNQNITVDVDAGTCEAAVIGLSVTATDGCGSVTITNDSPFATNPNEDASGLYSPGAYVITYTATDDCGNEEFYVVNLTVLQPDPPTFTGLPATNLIIVECGDPFPDFNISAFDGNGNDISNDIFSDITILVGDCALGEALETYDFLYSVNDACGQNASASFTVEIRDTQAPEWDSPNLNLVIDAECGDDVDAILAANLPTATDACGTTTVNLVLATSGITCGGGNASSGTYTYEAVDNCGNANPDLFTITVNLNDTQAPLLSGVPNDVTIGCGDPYPNEADLFANLAAFDACDGDLTGLITILPPGLIVGCVPAPTIEYNYLFSVIDACGNETSADFTITVINDLTVDLGPDQSVCGNAITLDAGNPGLEYEWSTGAMTQTIDVTMAGTYSVTVSGGNGCCAIGSVTVTGGTAPDAMATGGTLSCATGSVQLMGSSTTPGVSYSWTGPNNFMSGDQNPFVTMPGTYTLTVTSPDGCTATADAVVDQDANVPNLTAMGTTIDCGPGPFFVTANSTTPGVTYLWTDPDGFTTTDQNAEVFTTGGTYTVVATAPNGCTATAMVEVILNNAPPTLTAPGDALDCATSSVQLMATGTPAGGTYSWTGPNAFMSSEQNPTVTLAGDYMVTYTGTNGCTAMATATVTGNTDAPDAMATGGTLSCATGNVQLMGSSTTPGVSYSWTGPNSFMSGDQNPFVTLPGTYTLTVTAPNGCTATADAIVDQDANVPDLTAMGTTIDCGPGPFFVTANSTTPGVTYLWTDPDGFTTTDQNPEVFTTLGTYTIVVTAPNGCTATTTVEVTQDIAEPMMVTATGGTLDCATGTLQLMGNSTTPGVTYAWTGPNAFMSSEQNPTVNTAGTYTLTVTGTNGCTATADAVVMDNPGGAPVAAFTAATNELQASFTDNSTGTPSAWAWDFGDGMSSTQQNPTHNYITPGTYTVCLTVTNDCGDNQVCESVTVDVSTTGLVTFNIGTVTGQPGDIVEIPVSVENFTDIVSFQKSIHVADPTVARLVGVNNFNLSELDNSDFNLASDETITSVWFSATGISVADGEVIYTIQVELLSTVDECTAVFMDDNPTFVEVGAINGGLVGAVPYVLNGGEACILAKVDILGKVYRETGAPLDEVVVDCTGQPATITDVNGDYAFLDMTAGQPYTVTPSRNTNHVDGVTALDLALIQRHILNVQMLDSPYKIIAADVDVSGLVSGIDLVKIQQLILNITTEFPDFNSWRFVDQEYTFLNPANPLQEAFPEEIDFVSLDRDTMGNDFIAMKLGDVNNTAMGLQEPNGGNLNLVITETTDANGDLLISFRSAEHTAISAYQFDIWFDQYQMQFAEVIPGALPGLNSTFFGRNRLDEGLITTLWYDPTAQVDGWELEADEVLFTLKFAASNISTRMEERIQTNVATMRSAGYTNTGEALDIQTDYRSEVTSTSNPVEKTVSVDALQPNPFVAEATLKFFLSEGADVDVQLLDISGKQIIRQGAYYPAGQQRLQLDGRDLPAAGMYYLVFKAGAFTTTQKVVLQR